MGLSNINNNKENNNEIEKNLYMIEIEEVRRICTEELKYPLLEEYDFNQDNESANLPR